MSENTQAKNPDGSPKLPCPVAMDDQRVKFRMGFDTLCRTCKYGSGMTRLQRENPIQEVMRTAHMRSQFGEHTPGVEIPNTPIIIRFSAFCSHPVLSGSGPMFKEIEEVVVQCDFFENRPGGSTVTHGVMG